MKTVDQRLKSMKRYPKKMKAIEQAIEKASTLAIEEAIEKVSTLAFEEAIEKASRRASSSQPDPSGDGTPMRPGGRARDTHASDLDRPGPWSRIDLHTPSYSSITSRINGVFIG
jgi:hypothetical protein